VDRGQDLGDASDTADVERAICLSGLDFDGDGVCDREAADWSREASLPERGDRADIYRLGENRNAAVTAGIEHMLVWPVDVSGLLIPWRPMERTLDPTATDDLTLAYQQILRGALGFGTTDEMFEWLGLAEHDGSAEAMPGVPWPEWLETGDAMGFGLVDRPEAEGLTFSCATCHTADVFGRTVLGASNRQAQANEFFHNAAAFFPDVSPEFFGQITGAVDGELELFARAQQSIGAVATKVPQVRGLDTSLAQVSLSLARRAEDEFATRSEEFERRPRQNDLRDFVADSKPAVWWTVRYKTRWLSDGSIVSGNPVFTNFLWNEIGRGTDLVELQQWLEDNRRVSDELTALVFAVESPRWEDWFGVDSIDVSAAQRGHALFEETCATCHGSYEKGWGAPDANQLDDSALIANVYLDYPRQTLVLDVGTDPQRAAGMAAFAERLNELAISVAAETVVEVQEGYVPPPLDGIWIRYPYLHNGSVPTLCDMLLPASSRTPLFWMGPSADAETDFDQDCVGFPVGDQIPDSWQEDPRNEYDTSRAGLGSFGHDEWLTNEDGTPRYSADERSDLIEFLKTL
jgi:mono/diheme cytochrome c family protein